MKQLQYKNLKVSLKVRDRMGQLFKGGNCFKYFSPKWGNLLFNLFEGVIYFKGTSTLTEEVTFNSNNKWKSLWLLNFLLTAILDFTTCNGCPGSAAS